ncbi:hypothetical protein [Loigolactobacillus coryniformis]|uniref:Exonuclease SbcC n=1 Tax=Loigolactobacillus coryniformis TaxID=1610 RepID=A0A5B8TEI6_9LACO|nr:hypothetical protein [Loigolactobacillus coryniformis]QEA52242.1 hypothetical protein FGL77_02170 [Loigolactobacillus coryniformis]RRG06964.1 MAG: hypothetical protein DUD28_01455 [Lactobacillus sp.]
MDIEKSLDYQKRFFTNFAAAWQDHSDLDLYRGIDATADALRLDLSEVPGYILAYDKQAQSELRAYLQKGLVEWLQTYIPFFEVSADGIVMFGDWYHRRQFGVLDVWTRQIMQYSDAERQILPDLETYAADPENYLKKRLANLHDEAYSEADHLQSRLEQAQAAVAAEPDALTRSSRERSGGGFKGLMKNFIDQPENEAAPQNSQTDSSEVASLQSQLKAARAEAQARYDEEKRQIQVEAAVTNYEYQAIISQYSSLQQFENSLQHIADSYMASLAAGPQLAAQKESDDDNA